MSIPKVLGQPAQEFPAKTAAAWGLFAVASIVGFSDAT